MKSATAAAEDAPPALLRSPDRFINRELSWLEFNRRVLEESANRNHPLLERLRFLSISANNLDEFFMVRVAGLVGQVLAGDDARSSDDGLTPAEQLERIGARRRRAGRLAAASAGASCAPNSPRPGSSSSTSPTSRRREREWLEDYFLLQVFPVLTPLAVDPAHPFPFIPNLGFTLALEARASRATAGHERAGALSQRRSSASSSCRTTGAPAPARSSRSSRSSSPSSTLLFPGYKVVGQGVFRVIRDSDIEVEEEAEDLVRLFESALKRRRRGSVIRLEIEASMPRALRAFVTGDVDVVASGVVLIDGMLALDELVAARRARSAGSEVPALQSALSRARAREWRRLLRRDPAEGPRRPSPLRILRRRRAVPRAGGARSQCRGDQADALSHLGRQPDRARAGRGGRGGQVGDRAGRAEGALRRGGQHPLGARSRARRRAGRVRLHRIEDPRQAVDGGAARGRLAGHLLPRRHRQLSSGHGAHLHRHFAFHRRAGDRARRRAHLQLHHRLRRAGRARADGDLADRR